MTKQSGLDINAGCIRPYGSCSVPPITLLLYAAVGSGAIQEHAQFPFVNSFATIQTKIILSNAESVNK